MAYDEELAARVRDVLEPEGPVTEKRMFGGLGFLLEGGHMAVCAAGTGGLLVRVEDAEALTADGVVPMQMGPRTSRTWVEVDPHVIADAAALAAWVARGVAIAKALPPK